MRQDLPFDTTRRHRPATAIGDFDTRMRIGRFSLASREAFGFNVPMIFCTTLVSSARPALTALASLVCVSLLVACQSTDAKNDGGGKVKGNIVIRDQNNYQATSTLTIPRRQTAPQADLTICWSAMTLDFLCHDVAPATDINSLTFLQVLNLSESDVEQRLGTGESFASDQVHWSYRTSQAPGSMCTTLSKFADDPTTDPPKSPVVPAQDYTVASNKIYMLLFATGTRVGAGSKSMLFLEPTEGSTVTSVDAEADSCSILDFKADITTPWPVSAPAAGPTWVLDWSQLTKDGLGNELLFPTIDRLQLGYYENYTVAELQAKFLDLDRIATLFYELPIVDGAKYADLTAATTTQDGVNFAGFTQTQGVWAVALRCSSCSVPAPIAVAILSPSS